MFASFGLVRTSTEHLQMPLHRPSEAPTLGATRLMSQEAVPGLGGRNLLIISIIQ